MITNAGNAIRDCNACQAATTSESRTSNMVNAIRNCNTLQATATQVFANAFISVTYVLNGRKVTAKILKRLEKMKI